MSSMKIQGLFVFVSLINVILRLNTYDVEYDVVHRNKCLLSDMRILFLVQISLKECVKECSARPICQSVNYKRKYLLCELYSVDNGVFIDGGSGHGPCYFARKSSFVTQEQLSCSCDKSETCDVESNTCARKECPTLQLSNGVIHGNLNALGAEVKYACSNNYLEANNRTHSICEQTGTWSYIPRCVKECDTLTLSNGTIAENISALGSEVNFSCDENYIEVANKTNTTCQYTGEWSYIPRCITTTCSSTPISQFSQKYANVALRKTATLSSTYKDFGAYLMVDGNRNPNVPNCAHSGAKGYAVVDLGKSYAIYALYIINRMDCCTDRLRNVSISIGESMDNMNVHVYHKDPIGATCTFVLVQPCRGRYMKIVNNETASLTICELEVYGN